MSEKPILNLDPRYLPKLDDQIAALDNLIKQQQAQMAESQIEIAMHTAMLPLASKELENYAEQNGVIRKSSEDKEYKASIKRHRHMIELRQAAIDALLPELKRLQALKDEEDRKAAEEEAEKERKRQEEEAESDAD